MDIVPVSVLQAPEQYTHLRVKIYRKWTSRNQNNTGQSIFCCILLDKQGEAIQANMDIRHLAYFDDILKIDSTYEISNYMCEKTDIWQQTLDNNTSLRFGRITSFTPIPAEGFPDHHFNFISFNELESRIPRTTGTEKQQHPVLTDYISCIKFVSDPIYKGDANTFRSVRRKIHLENLNGNSIELTLWGSIATGFDKATWESMEQPVMLAVSSCRVSKYKDDVQLSSSYATHCYFNPNIPEVHEFLPRYQEKHRQQPPLNVIRTYGNNENRHEPRNTQPLQTLLTCNRESYKAIRFTSEVTITSTNPTKKWFYLSCTDCTKKPFMVGDVYKCIDHGILAQPAHRYCFKIDAKDHTAVARFIFFTPAGDKLLNLTCSELASIHHDPLQIPPQITAITGQTLTLQFRYNPKSGDTDFIVDDILQPTLTQPGVSGTLELLKLDTDHKSTAADKSETSGQSSAPVTPLPQHARNTASKESTPITSTARGTNTSAKRTLFQHDSSVGKKPKQE